MHLRRADADGQGRRGRRGDRIWNACTSIPFPVNEPELWPRVRARRRRPVHPPLLGLGRDEARSPARGRLRGRRARRGQRRRRSPARTCAPRSARAATGRASCRPGSPRCCAKCSGPRCKRAVSPQNFSAARSVSEGRQLAVNQGGSSSCARSFSPRSPPPRWCVTGASQPATTAVTKNVKITATAFTPANVTIKTGDSVKWTNNDTKTHQVVSNTGAFASAGSCPTRPTRTRSTLRAPTATTTRCTRALTGKIVVTRPAAGGHDRSGAPIITYGQRRTSPARSRTGRPARPSPSTPRSTATRPRR